MIPCGPWFNSIKPLRFQVNRLKTFWNIWHSVCSLQKIYFKAGWDTLSYSVRRTLYADLVLGSNYGYNTFGLTPLVWDAEMERNFGFENTRQGLGRFILQLTSKGQRRTFTATFRRLLSFGAANFQEYYFFVPIIWSSALIRFLMAHLFSWTHVTWAAQNAQITKRKIVKIDIKNTIYHFANIHYRTVRRAPLCYETNGIKLSKEL